jgi:hypothetical protein
MHHYRCQNVYISSTANERIVDTLEFFPHNYQMPQLSSTDQLIMAANDMTDALQNPHPAVPFTQIGNDTIAALAELAAIFKLKLRQTPAATLPTAPLKVIQRQCLAESSNPLLDSPMPPPRQTRSQTTIHTQDMTNAPLPPRVVTPRTLRPSPPRVPTRSRRLSPRSQRSHPPRHGKRNGIHSTHERSPSPANLETRFWQRMRTPLPRNSRHPWY